LPVLKNLLYNKIKQMDYELDIIIDESALDVECLEQSRLMLKYTKHSAQCRKAADEAEEALDLIKAEVEKEIREDPERFEIPKITEASVKAAILMDRRVKKAIQTWIDAKFEAKVADGAVTAFSNRKDMLEAMIKLHGQSYFAGPSVPHDLSKFREQKTQARNARIGGHMTRTT
jgi:hypothetical protein